MPLTTDEIESLEPQTKPYKRADGRGLYIFVTPKGSKLWRMAYRYAGRQKTLSFGPYPIVTLEEAREQGIRAKRLLRRGIDPNVSEMRRTSHPVAFNTIADEFLRKREAEGIAATTLEKKTWLLGFARAELGHMPVTDIKPADILPVLRSVEARGTYETAKRLRTTIGEVFRYAVATLRAETDPTMVLRGALISPKVRHTPAITDAKRFGQLIRAIWSYESTFDTREALKLMALLFPRPGELRLATWGEFDLDRAIWKIPAERTKKRRPHQKPLSTKAVQVLKGLRERNQTTGLVLPSSLSPGRPISENTMNQALRRLDFSSQEMTPHGFRASASTFLNESGLWNPDAIEAELAHVDTKSVRSIYNRALYWDERVRMLDWWGTQVTQYL
ncbi:MAG: tyrosine-type recombinase/integrase [Hyphomonadaceae bacterium]|nr:tyrosine-type recombinase/integrase [Hyphomonadaceae bacterium]